VWCFAFSHTSTFELIPSVATAQPGAVVTVRNIYDYLSPNSSTTLRILSHFHSVHRTTCKTTKNTNMILLRQHIAKTNEPISMQIGINLPPGQGHDRSTSEVRRSKVNRQGHRRPKLCLKVWRRHHSRSFESTRWRHAVSDGNVVFERGAGAGCCT